MFLPTPVGPVPLFVLTTLRSSSRGGRPLGNHEVGAMNQVARPGRVAPRNGRVQRARGSTHHGHTARTQRWAFDPRFRVTRLRMGSDAQETVPRLAEERSSANSKDETSTWRPGVARVGRPPL